MVWVVMAMVAAAAAAVVVAAAATAIAAAAVVVWEWPVIQNILVQSPFDTACYCTHIATVDPAGECYRQLYSGCFLEQQTIATCIAPGSTAV